jgi:uncharacterized membrane protein YeiB
MSPAMAGSADLDAAREPAAKQSGRLDLLDVLRGIALFGMFLVHFNIFSMLAGKIPRSARDDTVPPRDDWVSPPFP